MGVPVTLHRLQASSLRAAFACSAAEFLMQCPSSSIKRSHLTCATQKRLVKLMF